MRSSTRNERLAQVYESQEAHRQKNRGLLEQLLKAKNDLLQEQIVRAQESRDLLCLQYENKASSAARPSFLQSANMRIGVGANSA